MTTILVIGGGPAGLAAAIAAARTGVQTLLFERNDQCGVKLLATGGGHCNLTNTCDPDEWPVVFGKRGRFIQPALDRLPREKFLAWLADLGQPAECVDGLHYFPVSNSAKAVRDACLTAALAAGVTVRTSARVGEIFTDSGKVRGIGLADGPDISCGAVIVACGGNSYPGTGSTWDGCRLAESLGHRVNPPLPGLVGLKARNLCQDLAGISLSNVLLAIKGKNRPVERRKGIVLFTHSGISGPAVLDLSATVAERLTGAGETGGVVVSARWQGDGDDEFWTTQLSQWRTGKGGIPVARLLADHFPQRFARWLCVQAGIPEGAAAANLRSDGQARLVAALTAYPIAITGTEGWNKAMITRGGVDVRGIDPHTMASRLVEGLYFAGEMVDMDGPCGGYNLHWAFASGTLAGESAAGGK